MNSSTFFCCKMLFDFAFSLFCILAALLHFIRACLLSYITLGVRYSLILQFQFAPNCVSAARWCCSTLYHLLFFVLFCFRQITADLCAGTSVGHVPSQFVTVVRTIRFHTISAVFVILLLQQNQLVVIVCLFVFVFTVVWELKRFVNVRRPHLLALHSLVHCCKHSVLHSGNVFFGLVGFPFLFMFVSSLFS